MKEEKQFINAIFKANESVRIVQVRKKEGWRQKTVDRTFLQGQSAELFRAAIKSQATRDPYERRLSLF